MQDSQQNLHRGLEERHINLMALGEHREAWPDVTHMLFIKISTGIGTGLIMDGALQRGAQGARPVHEVVLEQNVGDVHSSHLSVMHDKRCRMRLMVVSSSPRGVWMGARSGCTSMDLPGRV